MEQFIKAALLIVTGMVAVQCGESTLEEPEFSDTWPQVPGELEVLQQQIEQQENSLPVREDNEARIRWYDRPHDVTEYSFVYLHGFAGSYRDGYPLNVNIADTFGANIYLSRWVGHGLKPPASLEDFSPEAAWKSAKRALAIGHKIGNKVIIISTSTGGTLALMLAATYPDSVHALINISPNLKDAQEGAFLLTTPAGSALAKAVALGTHREIQHPEEEASQYWDTIYPAEALVQLQVLLDATMKEETFKKINSPVLTLYYKGSFFKEDTRVEVDEYPAMYEALSTPDSLQELKALESPQSHFIGSDIKSEDYQVAQKEIIRFCRQKLGMELEEVPEKHKSAQQHAAGEGKAGEQEQ